MIFNVRNKKLLFFFNMKIKNTYSIAMACKSPCSGRAAIGAVGFG
jgi:hypothetical protein